MRKGYGNCPASAAEPGELSFTTLCSTSQASAGAAIIGTNFRFANPVTGAPLAYTGWGLKPAGLNGTASIPQVLLCGFGGRA